MRIEGDETGGVGAGTGGGTADAGTAGGAAAAVTFDDVARELGWVPKEEFKGDPSKWTDAKAWVKRTSSLNDEYRHEIKSLRKTVDGMAKTFKSSVAAAREEGIKQAQAQRREAIKAGDVEAVEKIDQQIDTLKKQPAEDPGEEILPEVQRFVSRHAEWWNKDEAMTDDALDYKERYIVRHPGASPDEVLNYVETKIKRDYPEKFKAKAAVADDDGAGQVSAVEGGGRQASGGKVNPIAKVKAHIYADPELKRVAKMFIDGGGMTEEEYFGALLKTKDFAHLSK